MKSLILKIFGEINCEQYNTAYDTFLAAKPKQPIDIILNSEGGSATDAIAIAELMRKHQGTVSVHAAGYVASAATMILAAGHKSRRTMASSTTVMIHEEFIKLSGRVSEVERQIHELRKTEDLWCDLLFKYTRTPSATWKKLHETEKLLSPKVCQALRLVDIVVP